MLSHAPDVSLSSPFLSRSLNISLSAFFYCILSFLCSLPGNAAGQISEWEHPNQELETFKSSVMHFMEHCDQDSLDVMKVVWARGQSTASQVEGLLIYAAKMNKPRCLKVLFSNDLEFNADVRDPSEDSGGQHLTPLIYASIHEHKSVMRILLEQGKANIDATAPDGGSALVYAALAGKKEAVSFLLEKNANRYLRAIDGGHALIMAAYHKHADIAELLLARHLGLINLPDNAGRTPMMWAAWGNSTEVAQLFMDTGVNPVQEDLSGRLATHYAAENGSVNILELLHLRGLPLSEKDKAGDTVLTLGVKNGHADIVAYVLAHHPDTSNFQDNCKSAMNLALKQEQYGCFSVLAEEVGGCCSRRLIFRVFWAYDDPDYWGSVQECCSQEVYDTLYYFAPAVAVFVSLYGLGQWLFQGGEESGQQESRTLDDFKNLDLKKAVLPQTRRALLDDGGDEDTGKLSEASGINTATTYRPQPKTDSALPAVVREETETKEDKASDKEEADDAVPTLQAEFDQLVSDFFNTGMDVAEFRRRLVALQNRGLDAAGAVPSDMSKKEWQNKCEKKGLLKEKIPGDFVKLRRLFK